MRQLVRKLSREEAHELYVQMVLASILENDHPLKKGKKVHETYFIHIYVMFCYLPFLSFYYLNGTFPGHNSFLSKETPSLQVSLVYYFLLFLYCHSLRIIDAGKPYVTLSFKLLHRIRSSV